MKRRRAATLAAVLVAALLLAALLAHPLRHYRAALVLADIAAGQGPSLLKRTAPAPRRQKVAYRVADQPRQGDLYSPGGTPHAALLLIPGVAEEGRNDPRLVAFAKTMARAGFAVLVPELPNLQKLQVGPADVREVAAAFAWLTGEPARAPQGRAGMAAFSYAVGPALLAAMEADIRQQVDFVFAVGGYYDLTRVMTFFTTGYYRHQEEWHYLRPHDYGKWAFVVSNIERLQNPDDRRIFRSLARRKMADPAAPTEDLSAQLGSEGRSLLAFILNRDPQRAGRLLTALPPALRADIAALNLADKDLSRLKARLILVHGLQDRMIPYVESAALADAVKEGQARLILVQGLQHVDMAPGLRDSLRLWRAVALLLAARDGDF